MRSRVCVINEILGNAIFLFISSFIMVILSFIPNTWLPETTRFYLILGIGVLTLIYIAGKLFYSDLKRYDKAKKIVDDYYETLPRILFFRKLKREISLDIDGNAEIVYELNVINKSDENVRILDIPMVTEMGSPEPDDGKYVKIKKMLIGTKEITDAANRCYVEKGTMETKDGKKIQYGKLKIPFTDIGSLLTESEKEVKAEFSIHKPYYNLKTKEYTGLQIRHPTEKVEMIIRAPSGWKLIILTSDTAHDGIEVEDSSAGLIDMNVTRSTQKPILKNSDTVIEWNINKPRINYMYKVYFRISK